MVFYIRDGVCCSDIPLPNMVLKDSLKYLLMEYRNSVVSGKFFVEYEGIQDIYDELDDKDFFEKSNLDSGYLESIHNFKKELVIMMALLD